MKPNPSLDFEKAWLLWTKLHDCADQLWDTFAEAFAQRCLEESRFQGLPDDLANREFDLPF